MLTYTPNSEDGRRLESTVGLEEQLIWDNINTTAKDFKILTVTPLVLAKELLLHIKNGKATRPGPQPSEAKLNLGIRTSIVIYFVTSNESHLRRDKSLCLAS